MAVHIRLQRRGNTHNPFYHVVAADQRMKRDGRFIEKLGYYDPQTEPSTIVVKEDRIQYWYSKGAQFTETVAKLVKAKKLSFTRQATEVSSKS